MAASVSISLRIKCIAPRIVIGGSARSGRPGQVLNTTRNDTGKHAAICTPDGLTYGV